MNCCMDGWIIYVNRWMMYDEWMVRWMDRWLVGWINGWIVSCFPSLFIILPSAVSAFFSCFPEVLQDPCCVVLVAWQQSTGISFAECFTYLSLSVTYTCMSVIDNSDMTEMPLESKNDIEEIKTKDKVVDRNYTRMFPPPLPTHPQKRGYIFVSDCLLNSCLPTLVQHHQTLSSTRAEGII